MGIEAIGNASTAIYEQNLKNHYNVETMGSLAFNTETAGSIAAVNTAGGSFCSYA